jgi:uncharacterized protein (TIGR03118 family)
LWRGALDLNPVLALKGRTTVVKPLSRNLASAVFIAVALTGATAVRADDDGFKIERNAYVVNKLVSDQNGVANFQDPVLRNAWGVAFTPGASPFWIADNASGCSTLYDGTGVKVVTLQVPIPLPDNSVPSTACQPAAPAQTNPPPPTPAAPTGVVWNPTTTFLVPGTSTPALFIFATEDGTISAWANGASGKPNNQAVIAFDNSASGAVYKGLVAGTNPGGVFLFATNFHAGTVDVFKPADNTSNGQYIETTTTGGFKDSNIPAGFAPFGIENINGDLFVSYAKQDAAMHDDVAGPGNGFVDVFDTNGNLLRRFASRGPLNSPWGMTRASFAFGRFSGLILVGNFGNGKTNVFSSQGQFIDELDRPNGKPLVIDGLWKLILGGGRNSSSDTLYFTAGPNDETNGLFGTIMPASKR